MKISALVGFGTTGANFRHRLTLFAGGYLSGLRKREEEFAGGDFEENFAMVPPAIADNVQQCKNNFGK